MLYLLISDIHGTYKSPIGRNDNVGEAFESKLEFVLSYARKKGCVILQAGDLNDKARNWDVLNFLIKSLRKFQTVIFCVFGQHDLYMRRDPNDTPSALSILVQSGFVMRLGKKPITTQTCCIYGANWGDKIPKPKRDKRKRVLVLHAPISVKKLYPKHDYTSPAYFMSKHAAYDLVLVGDVHRHIFYETGKYLMDKRYLINTGPMLRTEATMYNMRHKPCFYVWDSNTNEIERVIIPHKKGKKVLTREHIEQKKFSEEELEQFTKTIKNMESVGSRRLQNIKKFVKKNIKSTRVKKIIKEVINGIYNPGIGRQDTSLKNDIRDLRKRIRKNK